MLTGVRLLILVSGVILAALGLVLFATGWVIAGIWTFVGGAAITVGVLIERTRYRSAAAEMDSGPPGPGGGEPLGEAMEARFRRTDEVFIDPTSKRTMRVWMDPATGERRYRAED